MNRSQIETINKTRLVSWRDKLTAAHATPIALVGVGHDHKSGELTLCVTENGYTNEELAGLLRWAATQLSPEISHHPTVGRS